VWGHPTTLSGQNVGAFEVSVSNFFHNDEINRESSSVQGWVCVVRGVGAPTLQ